MRAMVSETSGLNDAAHEQLTEAAERQKQAVAAAALLKRTVRDHELEAAEQRRRAEAALVQVELLSKQKDETLSQHVAAAAEARRRAEHATVELAAVAARLQQRDQVREPENKSQKRAIVVSSCVRRRQGSSNVFCLLI
jgi:hypothetical protein